MGRCIIAILAFSIFLSCGSKDSKETSVQKGLPAVDYTKKLETLNIKLSKPAPPVANYVNVTQAGNILFLAGKGPTLADGSHITGKVGQDLTVKEGYIAARQAGITQLSVLKSYLGDLKFKIF